jgi:hypothetical protein
VIHAVVLDWVLGNVWLKEILRLINIVAELEVVNFSHISLIEVFSNEHLE